MRMLLALWLLLPAITAMFAQETHHHPAPEKLGSVFFATSCAPATQKEFNRGVALLHSFTYDVAETAFKQVAAQDPQCAIAHWGIAMTHFHQLWDVPPTPADAAVAVQELKAAGALPEASPRERGFIHALGLLFQDTAAVPYTTRAEHYEAAMGELASANPEDVESRTFYALALLSNASPTDKTHRRQKAAAAILEPLYRRFPDHPGMAHYLIHAYDNQELAPRGLGAARAYAGIAPSAPHALHMPSHIFTRLGLWDESIASNLAAQHAAQQQGDTGEQLHAMDYLVYAYLQTGRDRDAAQVVDQLRSMPALETGRFKVGYAATAMPVRCVVERGRWREAQGIANPPGQAQPHVTAIAVWARGLGFARDGRVAEAEKEAATLRELTGQLRASGVIYWATQVDIMRREVAAWSAQAAGRPEDALTLLRGAADDEDSIEKLPVTPGPVVPARQQMGEMLLAQGQPALAARAFQAALLEAPGRQGALQGAARAAVLLRAQSSTR